MLERAVRSILVATDLSEGSDDVVGMAGNLALRVGAELHAVHSLEDQAGPFGFDLVRLQGRIRDAHAELEGQLRRVVPPEVPIGSLKLEYQPPHKAIVRRAKECGAALIVVGPHRARLPGSHLLGTTAQRVVQQASVPCLVGRGGIGSPLRKVLLAVGPEDLARGLIPTAPLWIAALNRSHSRPIGLGEPCDLRILHVVRNPDEWRDFSAPFAEALRLAAELPEVHPGLRMRRAVAWSRSPGDEILSIASDTDTDLIAMGVCGKGPLLHAVLGSVSSAVLKRSDIPVLLFPPQVCGRLAQPSRIIPFPVQIGIR